MNLAVIVSSVAVCGVWAMPLHSNAQAQTFTGTVGARLVADDPDQTDRDVADAVDQGYVEYVSQIKGFDPHYYGIPQVKREAAEYAAKIEALLQVHPEYRSRTVGSLGRDASVQMTVGELVDKLNHAEEIIHGDQADAHAQNMSVFVQGDVEDWKNRTDKIEADDGFVLLADYEYPLLFNRAEGDKQMLARYAKGNGGKPLPASAIAPLHEQISLLLAKMNAMALERSFSDAHKPVEPFIVGFLKKQAPRNIPGAQVIKTSWTDTPWLIDKNALGIPVVRRRLGTVLYHVLNQKFDVEQHFFYHEAYAGGGKYARGADVNFSDLRFVKS
ncbi:MAG: hypothetical protein M3Y28_06375 [Armatimonadota bacterium]|nr:hypothetical protein [Armatimonadota bacterium]